MPPTPRPLTLALAASIALLPFARPVTAAGVDGPAAATAGDAGASARYLIVLREPALAAYRGGDGRTPPPRIAGGTRRGRLDVNAGAARDYVAHLAGRQAAVVAGIERQLGRPVPPLARLQHALNGVVAELTPAEAAQVAARSDVARVEADETLLLNAEPGPSFIGADAIWNGSASGGLATQGEGIVIGLIDSGINWRSPSFAATGPVDGHVHVNPLGTGHYLGACGATAPNPDLGHCNDKLIGLYNFVDFASSAEDGIGHGTHTASTAGGNHRVVDSRGGTFAIAGIAPHANLVMFSCFNGSGCSSLAAVQAADQAVAGGLVDVLNFSVAGGTAPWSDAVSQAFLGATEAGLFVAAAAGNDGPDAQSVNHVEPWVTTTAASTLDHTTGFDFSLDLPGGAPANTQHLGVHPGQEPMQTTDIVGLPIVRSPSFDNLTGDGCSPFAAGTFTGALAVLRLRPATSACSSTQRKINAEAAGASGVLFVDAGTYIPVGATGAAWSMLLADWENVWAAIQASPGAATASIRFPLSMYPDTGDHIADFSGRGPNVAGQLGGQYLLKPDISAPGVAILAAVNGGADAVDFMDGTSMATPHIAGAAALLRAVRPDWTPMEIKSALATTAWTTGIVSQWGGPTTIWDRGAGRVDLATAARAGLLLDETGANFRAADPAQGGRLIELNLPSAVMGACGTDTCRFTRRLRNPLGVGMSWSVRLAGLSHASVTPDAFTLAPGATQDVTVSINPAAMPGAWTYAELRLSSGDSGVPDTHLPIAVKRNSGVPMLQLSSSALSATQAPDTVTPRTLTLSNGGTGAIHWSIDTASPGCARPAWAGYGPTSGTLLSGGSPRTLTVTIDTHGLVPGTQAATLCIASDDAAMPLAKVDLVLSVESVDDVFHDGFDGN